MCLSIGAPITINFPFVPNGKLMFLVSQFLSTLGYTLMSLSIGAPITINFPFVPNGKLKFLCPNFKHIRVYPNEVTHNELPHLDLHCLPSIL